MKEKYMKDFNGEKIFSLEYDKETLRDMVLDKQEEIEKLNKRINKVLEMLDKPYYFNLRIGALRDIQEILRGEQDEDNSTSK